MREMEAQEIGHLVRHVAVGATLKRAAMELPQLDLEATIQPITRTVLRVRLTVRPNFKWNDRFHGKSQECFWIWVEDPASDHMYHHEYFIITKKQVVSNEAQELCFTIPIFEPLPSQYYVRCTSDKWLGSETTEAISFQSLILPERHPPHTALLDLQPIFRVFRKQPEAKVVYIAPMKALVRERIEDWK